MTTNSTALNVGDTINLRIDGLITIPAMVVKTLPNEKAMLVVDIAGAIHRVKNEMVGNYFEDIVTRALRYEQAAFSEPGGRIM